VQRSKSYAEDVDANARQLLEAIARAKVMYEEWQAEKGHAPIKLVLANTLFVECYPERQGGVPLTIIGCPVFALMNWKKSNSVQCLLEVGRIGSFEA
jgi:hypothetical protein